MTHISPLAHSPGRWPGLFICALLLAVPATARATDSPIPFQSPDLRRLVNAVESRAPIVLDGALDEAVVAAAGPAAAFVHAGPHRGRPGRGSNRGRARVQS